MRRLRKTAMSNAEIARRTGLSPGQVTRLAAKLGLPARPSPIKREKRPQRRKPTASTLPPLASLEG